MATKKILLSLDEDLVEHLDEVAEERGLSRSAYTQELLTVFLPGYRAEERRRAFDDLERFVATLPPGPKGPPMGEVIREMRDEKTRQDIERSGGGRIGRGRVVPPAG